MMLGLEFQARHLFGLPERSDKFLLEDTNSSDPYRLFNVDLFPHQEFNKQGLYSSIPYVTGHSAAHDSSVLWFNAAETWVDISTVKAAGKRVNFISESGAIELFLIGSASKESPKRVANLLARVTGYPTLPPFFAIGFHYSKWEDSISAERIMYYNDEFEKAGIPVDVFWMDLPYTNDRMYFTFNPSTFKDEPRQRMEAAVSLADRRLVVLTDPHIKKNTHYHVFQNGMKKDMTKDGDGNLTSIFVKNPD